MRGSDADQAFNWPVILVARGIGDLLPPEPWAQRAAVLHGEPEAGLTARAGHRPGPERARRVGGG